VKWIITLELILLFSQPCLASNLPPQTTGKVVGITKEKHYWHKLSPYLPLPIRSTTYTYVTDENETFLYGRKIKGVKDLRSYQEIHPAKHWIIDVCERWQPVLNVAASAAIPAMQVVQTLPGVFKR
jgi:hypothetical protein